MSKKTDSALEELKATIVTTAAEAILSQMTPAMMRRVAEEVLEHVLVGLTDSKYSGLGREMTQQAEEHMRNYLKEDAAQSMIKDAVRRGVSDAAKGLDEQVKNEVVKTSLNAVHKALTTKPSSRY